MKISEIQKIIKDFEQSSLTELELELQEVKLKLSKNIIEKNVNIELECEILKLRGNYGSGYGKAYVDGELVCEGKLTFAIT